MYFNYDLLIYPTPPCAFSCVLEMELKGVTNEKLVIDEYKRRCNVWEANIQKIIDSEDN